MESQQLPLFDSVHEYKGAARSARKKGRMRYVRERLQQYGVTTLSSPELLALVLCTSAGGHSTYEHMHTLFTE